MKLTITETINAGIGVTEQKTVVTIADFSMAERRTWSASEATTTTASADITLTNASNLIQYIDPGGASRIVTLPAVSVGNHGFIIVNRADADAEIITVKDASATVIGYVRRNESFFVISNGITWIMGNVPGSARDTIGISQEICDSASAVSVGDGKIYILIPDCVNGFDITGIRVELEVPSTSGTPTFMLARGRRATPTSAYTYADILATAITIDANEYSSETASTPYVIDPTKCDLQAGDKIRVDCDVAGTGAKGASISIDMALPSS